MKSPQLKPRAGFLKWLALVSTVMLSASCARQPQAGASGRPTPPAAGSSASPIPWATIQPPAQVGAASGTPEPRLPVRTFRGKGVVRLINLKEGWFEIDHEEIVGLMPAMQMEWSVRDRSLLKSVSVGDRVDFTLEDDNGNEAVTELKKSP
ncbi:MAG: copper-binding protein [Pyrinomonadaceae bacterium]